MVKTVRLPGDTLASSGLHAHFHPCAPKLPPKVLKPLSPAPGPPAIFVDWWQEGAEEGES
jgi:hypothetical protein